VRRGPATAVAILCWCAAPSKARAAEGEAVDVAPPPRTARFTANVLVGSGYGWSKGYAEVNRDFAVSGGGWAQLGHMIVEGGVLFPRAHLFVVTGPRFQFVTGTTDVYGPPFVAHTRRNAFAWFSKIGWLPRSPDARVQPYLSLSSGYGRIAHTASLPLSDCGPNHDQACVDTVAPGPLFIGWGAGVRIHVTAHLDAVVALENELGMQTDVLVDLVQGRGFEERILDFDGNVGVAATF
jgi:hypothetical protein